MDMPAEYTDGRWRLTYTLHVRVIRVLASVVLLGMEAAALPGATDALSCVRPWAYELDGARMAVTEGFGAGGFDGFLIAKVTGTASGPSGSVSHIDLAVSVAFEVVVPRDLHIGVGPHGPLTTFQADHAYFLTLHKSTDSTLPPLFVHPCGPAFELSSRSELDNLLSMRVDETVVDDGLLAELRRGLPPTGFEVPILLTIVTAGAFLILSQRRRVSSRC